MTQAMTSNPQAFTVEHRDGWRLRTPGGEPFRSIGIVHADDTNLRYPHNLDIYRARYGGSRRRWLREGLIPEMMSWGFNTVGWTSEYVSGSGLATEGRVVDLGHSEGLPPDDLAGAGVPYTLSLRVGTRRRATRSRSTTVTTTAASNRQASSRRVASAASPSAHRSTRWRHKGR
ncbi:hypothetical protein [Micromonospora musae]|uniref:hypothetical protein n=1 Tax=Micromonospora musae TaxID=1894970 RepID=UPI00342E48BE